MSGGIPVVGLPALPKFLKPEFWRGVWCGERNEEGRGHGIGGGCGEGNGVGSGDAAGEWIGGGNLDGSGFGKGDDDE